LNSSTITLQELKNNVHELHNELQLCPLCDQPYKEVSHV
jgi:hypothetical protein